MNGKIVFRILSALVFLAAVAGIAYFAYNAGVTHGSPVTIQAPDGQSVPAPYPPYGFGMPFFPPFMFGFGCFGILIPLLLLALAFRAFRFMLWGPRFGHMHGHGMMHHGMGERGVPSMFEEWHKRAHGEQPAEEKKA